MGYISLTGNPITFTTNRENTISSLVLQGKTNQPGTGDPSPTNIRPISGVGEYRTDGYYADVVITDENGAHTITAGPLSAPLYDGDTLDFVSGEVVRNNRQLLLAIKDMNNSEDFPGWKGLSVLIDDYPNANSSLYSAGIRCVLNIASSLNVGTNTNPSISSGILFLFKNVFGLTQTQWKEQYPDLVFQIVYQLATPTTETVPISAPITNAAGTVTLSAENTLQVTYFQLEASNNKYQDIQISDGTLFNEFKIAWETNDFSTAFNIIENNPQLNTKKIVALVINSLNENLTDLQNMNDPTFKADKIQVSVTPPVDLQTGEVYFEII